MSEEQETKPVLSIVPDGGAGGGDEEEIETVAPSRRGPRIPVEPRGVDAGRCDEHGLHIFLMTRARVAELKDALMTAGNVSVHEKDDAIAVRKFRYAVGRNFARCCRIDAETEQLQRALMDSKQFPAFQEYDAKRQALCVKHCEKDTKGDAMMRMSRDGNPPQFAFSAAGHAAFMAEWEMLRGEYKDAIAEHDAHLQAVDAIGDETVEVGLHLFSFESVPVLLNAAHVSGIDEMFFGKPAA